MIRQFIHGFIAVLAAIGLVFTFAMLGAIAHLMITGNQ